MEDVLDLLHEPYDAARPVIALDEASKQLVRDTRRPIRAARGRIARIDHEYERNGTAELFMLCEPLAGWREVRVRERRTRSDFAHVVRELLDVHYPHASTVRLIVDNLNTHNAASLYEAFEPELARRLASRLEWHYTPKHGSWLNPAELELAALSKQCLSRRIGDLDSLQSQTAAWTRDRNQRTRRIIWQFTTADARVRLHRLYPQYQA